MRIEVDDQEIRQKLNELASRLLPDLLEKGMERACQVCENEAKRNAPVDDGTLRAGITHEVVSEAGEIAGYVYTNVEYAPYVHEGTGIYATNGNGRKQVPWVYRTADGIFHTTSGQKPNPFLKNAINAKQGDILECFRNLDQFGGVL